MAFHADLYFSNQNGVLNLIMIWTHTFTHSWCSRVILSQSPDSLLILAASTTTKMVTKAANTFDPILAVLVVVASDLLGKTDSLRLPSSGPSAMHCSSLSWQYRYWPGLTLQCYNTSLNNIRSFQTAVLPALSPQSSTAVCYLSKAVKQCLFTI